MNQANRPEPDHLAEPVVYERESLPSKGTVCEVFLAFLRLGLTSFGGPIAHLGYFHSEFVERRKWLDDKSYSDLVALCQFLPGPTSSQVGIALGLSRAGWRGALAAWFGFTVPSAIALILFAFGVARSAALAQSGAIHGLKIVAVAIVAQAVWGMAKSLCPDRPRACVAIAAAILVFCLPTSLGQIVAIIAGGMCGRWMLAPSTLPVAHQRAFGISKNIGANLLGLFCFLLVFLPVFNLIWPSPILLAISSFYKAGALVFGGGHVVLPLLQASVVPTGLISNDLFVAGYGAAQAVPGPLFTFAAYLGAVMPSPLGGWIGGITLLITVFVPAFLILMGTLPFWEILRQRGGVQAATAGVNAAVVGVLAAALYDPLFKSSIHAPIDFVVALTAFGLLVFARLSPVLVVTLAALTGWVLKIIT